MSVEHLALKKDLKWVADRLCRVGSCAIELKFWNNSFLLELQSLLPEQWHANLMIEIDELRGWVHLSLPEVEAIKVYPERSRWRRLLPLIWLGLLYLVPAHIFAGIQYGSVFAMLFAAPLFPVLLGALFSYAIQYHQPVSFQQVATDIFRMLIIIMAFSELLLIEQFFLTLNHMSLFAGTAILLLIGGAVYIMLLAGAVLMSMLCDYAWQR